MFGALNSLKELVFPDICIGCSSPNSKFCFNCQLNWKSPVKKSYVGSNPLYFKSNYGTEAASIILLAKESSNHEAIKTLAASIAESIIFAVKDMKINSLISIVTVPSSKSSIRRRGRDHINSLALEVVKKIASHNFAVEHLPILMAKKNIKDQSKLNGSQRSENTKGNFGVIGCEFPQGAIFLIDDLVTTGSSMLEAVRALSEAKMTVTALVSACAVGRNSLIP
jgi:predicted amidophosphoribosyltransferase